jgi:ATP-dependent Lon protease
VKQVILPADNKEDFDLLPEHIREGVSAVFVKTFEDVRRICFPDNK